MKIALIARDYHSRGGLERVSQFYARTLREHGHEVHVWYGNGTTSALDDGIKMHRINTFLKSGWLYCLLFSCLAGFRVKPTDYDAVVSMGIAGLCGGSTVVANSVHKRWFHYSLAQLKPGSLRWWLKIFNPTHYVVMLVETLQYCPGMYKAIIAVSEPIKVELVEYYEIPPERIFVLPNGANVEVPLRNETVRAKTRQELGIQHDELLMCMLVNELERKGVRQTMAALNNLRQHPLKLLVVSKVSEETVEKLAEHIGVSDRVIVRPSTPDAKPYLWASDVYVLPTEYEAWNLSIMEAHAAGLPIITTKLNQADSIVIDGQTGFLLNDPTDVQELTAAIERFVALPNKANVPVLAQRSLEEYSWPNIVTRLERILTQVNDVPAARTAATTSGSRK